jgi:uncharacterized protein (TIGR00296 family)
MLTLEDGVKTVKYSRKTIESILKNKKIISNNLDRFFKEKLGVFVTIHTYPNNDLRGCMGIPYPIMSLNDSIKEASKSVINDPRFPILTIEELNRILIEVTVLSKPIKIKISEPIDYIKNIKIGKDGLIIKNGFHSGLLLPQVPIEHSWNIYEYLENICLKAGLPPNSWKDKESIIYKFLGQVFSEIEPNGEIKEKYLDGSNC